MRRTNVVWTQIVPDACGTVERIGSAWRWVHKLATTYPSSMCFVSIECQQLVILFLVAAVAARCRDEHYKFDQEIAVSIYKLQTFTRIVEWACNKCWHGTRSLAVSFRGACAEAIQASVYKRQQIYNRQTDIRWIVWINGNGTNARATLPLLLLLLLFFHRYFLFYFVPTLTI